MPKKPKDQIRVPLNCLIAPDTKTAITGLQNTTRESQGEIVDRAVALLVLGEEVEPKVRKKSRRDREIEARAASDVTAQVVGRPEIDYSDTESAPSTHVANLSGSWSERLAQNKKPREGFKRPMREKGDSTR